MISVIIPALNEASTVKEVVLLALNANNVTEVIVVDDKSMDDTVINAKNAGAKIITSTKLGKGASMLDGILVAQNECIVFLDADITTYQSNVIELLTVPILNDTADFTKSFFERQAGRVTELVAKPLLALLNPDFPSFKQPLSGMIAGKKSFFVQCKFEEGYGVDIGLLIDMYHLGARIKEVNIGKIENRLQQLEQLGKMSREVAKTIIQKSAGVINQNLEIFENIQVVREQMEFAIRDSLLTLKKMAIFDMDNTILRGSFIQQAAIQCDFKENLVEIVTNNNNPFVRTKMIAQLLKGKRLDELIQIVDQIKITPNLSLIIQQLKENGYIVGIISDSYDCITNHLKNKYEFDFSIANELEFSRSIATGEVRIPSFFINHSKSNCKHELCKLNSLEVLCEKYQIDIKNTLYVGDGENDICCIRNAGIGISFCSTNYLVDTVADFSIKEPDFAYLGPIIA
ncbi:HAD-IB family phosphatase [Sediminibacterium sp.]|uniref:HAD-IB family phosphatase n=1 Tax=Sediminibacterium sp. TaxID=1917865 RepID=UPI003F7241DD